MATKYAGQNALNKLMQIIKTALANKADKVNATTSAAGLMSAADKTKLDGIAEGANKTVVDSELSASSTNPVQNKAVKGALDELQDKTEDYYVTFARQKDSSGHYTDEYTANHTAKEIYEAYQAGNRVWRLDVTHRYQITRAEHTPSGAYYVDFIHFEPGNLVVCYSVSQESDTSASTASKLVYGIIAPNPGSDDNNKFLKVSGSKITYADIPDAVTIDAEMSADSTNPVQNKAIKAALDKKLDKSGGTVTGFLRVNDSVYAEGHISAGLNISAKMLQLTAEGSTDDNPVLVDIAPNADDASALDVLALDGGATKYGSIIVATPTDAQTKYAATVEYVKNKVSGLQTADQVKTAINSAISGVYTPKGSIAFKSLPTAAAGNKGWVYNITDAFTTTAAFVEGAGHAYGLGTNVVCVDAGSGSYKWDVLAGTIDLTELTADEVQTLWNSI